MAYAITRTTGNGSTPTFTIGFNYRDEADLIVKVNGVTQTLGTHFQVTTGGTIIDFSQGTSPLGAPTNGHAIFISRSTSQNTRLVDYAAGSVFKEADLDTDSEQGFFMSQEAIDIANESITVDANNNWDADNKRIINVADPVNNQDAVNKQFISTNIPNITTVAGISNEVTSVAGVATEVDVLVNKYDGSTTATSGTNKNITQVDTVADNIGSVNTVATNINDVVTVANDLNEAISEIEVAAADLQEATSEIDTVANAITNVDNVGNNIGDVTTVAGQISPTNNVSTVAGVATEITTVAGQISPTNNVLTVANNATQIGTVAGQISPTNNIQTVANADTNIGTVATDLSGTNTIGTVAADLSGSNNIGTVAGVANNITTVANNIADVNNFADTYFVGTTAPASPTTGDLWFDSNPSVLVMKVYNGSGFVNAGSAVNGTADRESYVVGTSSGSYTGSTTVFPATYDSGFVDLYLNGVKLVNGTDFTATNGTSITLTSAAATGDTVDIISFGTFTLANIAANDLTDVYTTGVADGQILQYSGTNSRFEPVTFQGGAGYFVGENGTTGNTSTGLGDIFRVHEAALDTATTIPSNTNALAAGPLTLNAALTVNGTVTVV